MTTIIIITCIAQVISTVLQVAQLALSLENRDK